MKKLNNKLGSSVGNQLKNMTYWFKFLIVVNEK